MRHELNYSSTRLLVYRSFFQTVPPPEYIKNYSGPRNKNNLI